MAAKSDVGVTDMFRGKAAAEAQGVAAAAGAPASAAVRPDAAASGGTKPLVVKDESSALGWGRGPVAVDSRKYRYDRIRALTEPAVPFSATKADRLDPDEAGDVLHGIHVSMGIDKEDEARLAAFDAALWWQHTLNGASVLQDGRGVLSVGSMTFDISDCLKIIGEHRLRRFYRAFADDILEVNRTVLAGYSPYDFEAAEKYGQLMQVASARGLHKYPDLAFDAADACNNISLDARRVLLASKNLVIPSINETDRAFTRVGNSVRADDVQGRFGH